MVLGHIERGANLFIYEEMNNETLSEVYTADFHYLESDASFVVKCARLNESFDNLDPKAHLSISFMTGPFINTFRGRAVEKKRGGMVLIDQISDISTHNRRQFHRDEIRVPVRLHDLPETMRNKSYHGKPAGEPIWSDTSFDVSIGGMCIITNKALQHDQDPFFLIEFSLTERDYHVLPAKMVRRANCSRTIIGRFDYGFQFLFDHLPDDKARLTKGIIYRKMSIK